MSGHSDVRWAKDSLDKMKRDFKPPVIKARSKASSYDRQKAKVYEWEDVALQEYIDLNTRLSEESTIDFINEVYRKIGVEAPKIILSKRLKNTCYFKFGQIVLADWGQNKKVILHEIAHHVANSLGGKGRESHRTGYQLQRQMSLIYPRPPFHISPKNACKCGRIPV